MKSVLTLFFKNVLLNSSFSFRGIWALPLTFVSVTFVAALIHYAMVADRPYVGMSDASFARTCDIHRQLVRNDEFTVRRDGRNVLVQNREADEVYVTEYNGRPAFVRDRIYTTERTRHRCAGRFTFQEGVLVTIEQDYYE